MYAGSMVFAQLMDFLPWKSFRRIVTKYRGDHKVRSFSCAEHFRVMAFSQLTYRKSLRDLEAVFASLGTKAYHLGIRSGVFRNTLAYANETRDWRIYAEFAQLLIAKANRLYAKEELGLNLDAAVYALDSSTIDLCLSLFPWTPSQQSKAAIKLHTLMNLRGSIPEFIHISGGKTHDVNFLDLLPILPGAYYVMDRGYVDFERLYRLHQGKAYFVTRPRENLQYTRLCSAPCAPDSGVKSDQLINLAYHRSRAAYPEPLRRVRFYASDLDRYFIYLTNATQLPAQTIADLYKLRWQIELFFKWIKQNLRIESFLGYSANAVKVQIWTAVATYLLVAIVKKELGLKQPLSQILQVLSVCQFEKTPVFTLFEKEPLHFQNNQCCNQLKLFD